MSSDWIPEESIVFSQPSLFMLDVNQEKNHEIERAAKPAKEEATGKTEQVVLLKKDQGLQIKKSVKQVEKKRPW
jgi:hypothetical protein